MIRGILFHQGESDAGQPNRDQWLGKVQEIVEDLRADLPIGNVPFLAGELLYADQNGGAGDAMNPLVNMLPGLIPGALVVSAQGLSEDPTDTQLNLHFGVVAQARAGSPLRPGDARRAGALSVVEQMVQRGLLATLRQTDQLPESS